MTERKTPGLFDIDPEQVPMTPIMNQAFARPGSGGFEADMRANYHLEADKKEIVLDMTQFILDLTGMVEPTPFSDGSNALISVARGNWIDAVISSVSMIPYLGDLAKIGKFTKYLNSIRKAIKIAKNDTAWLMALRHLFTPLRKLIDQLIEVFGKKVPDELLHIKDEIDNFMPSALKGGAAPGGKISDEAKEVFMRNEVKGKLPSAKLKDKASSAKGIETVDNYGVKNTSSNIGIPEHTYRGDKRSPDEIFKKGFEPRAKGSDTSLEEYARKNRPSNYVGTSKDLDVAKNFADDGGYVYTVKSDKGVDVNKELGNRSPFPSEQEVVFPGGIEPKNIKGATPVNKDGTFGNLTNLNPNHYRKPNE